MLDNLWTLRKSKFTDITYSAGTIRVYCRVRPFLPGQGDGKSTVDHIGENGNIMIVHPHKQGRDARKVFSFNKVFGTNVTQRKSLYTVAYQLLSRISYNYTKGKLVVERTLFSITILFLLS